MILVAAFGMLIGIGAGVRISINLGKKEFNQAERVLGNSFIYEIGIHGIRIFLLMLPLVGFQVICSNYFQSIGKAKISLFLTLLRQVIVLLPLLTILPMYYGINGIWMASPISDFISTCVVFIFFRIERKKLQQLEMSFVS